MFQRKEQAKTSKMTLKEIEISVFQIKISKQQSQRCPSRSEKQYTNRMRNLAKRNYKRNKFWN